MTAAEVEGILRKHGVPDYDYSINRPRSTECLVLEPRASIWVIYFWERGVERFTKEYENEDVASREFARQVLWINSHYKLNKDEISLD